MNLDLVMKVTTAQNVMAEVSTKTDHDLSVSVSKDENMKVTTTLNIEVK
jgi:hypothetical protein